LCHCVATSEGNMRYDFRERIIERVQADKAASLLAELLNMIGFYLQIQLITFKRSASRLTTSSGLIIVR